MTKRVLLVGAGGIGSPAALVLAQAYATGTCPPFEIVAADDDVVERSNLHRQILFSDRDVGTDKLDALVRAVADRAPGLRVVPYRGRLLPDTAIDLVRDVDVVLDATDNFASRFLGADAANIVGRPIVHSASVRWHATVLASAAGGRPCYRCLFEDLPEGPAPDCATAGVVGPVCGVAGALAAELTLRILRGDESGFGWVYTYDGRRDSLRRVPLRARATCELCGALASDRIVRLEAGRYAGDACQD
ncbi:MAG: HesA/MoeB/ThiF family protein [Polyangiaceae bacterium]|nr:HesA/MoeB/ThiF family protein [Polyangiaceae bacterium]